MNKIKEKLIAFVDWASGNYELRLRSPHRIFLFFLEFTAWYYLLFYVAFSVEFNQKRDYLQFEPLIEGVKSGQYIVLNFTQYRSGLIPNTSFTLDYWSNKTNSTQNWINPGKTIP